MHFGQTVERVAFLPRLPWDPVVATPLTPEGPDSLAERPNLSFGQVRVLYQLSYTGMELHGACTRNRTGNLLFTGQVLSLLSYAGVAPHQEIESHGAWCREGESNPHAHKGT